MRYEQPALIRNSAAESPILTVLITIRVAAHYDMIERLRFRSIDTRMPGSVTFLVIDEGSSLEDAERLKAACAEIGFDYVRHNTEKDLFCLAGARNIGASLSRSQFIMFEDVDLFPYPGFYQDIIDEIHVQGLDTHSNRFLTVPCLYLTEQATEAALAGNLSKNEIIHDHLTGGPLVDFALPASSALIINRMFYLSIGGSNDQFKGWGLEDLELAYRLTRGTNKFMSPKDHRWLIEGGYAHNPTYRGWRSQFRLHGELLSRKSIYIFHAHHPRDTTWRNPELHRANKAIFQRSNESFDAKGHTLPSLPDAKRGRSLIFGRGTFAYNPALLPLWGDLEVKGYQDFQERDIVDHVRANGINRVIFTNPYANDMRLSVYNRVREANIPFYVVERGALTDSMFIDDTGFCCESTRYRREHWPAELDAGRLRRVQDYISTETSSGSALEKQGERIGARAALQKLGIPPQKKVLFVPFQSRSDTTVNHFAGQIGSFDNFVDLVRDVTKRLPPDWVVIFKKHPLSSVQETVPGAIDIGNMHIKDALELTDYVLLMNSGVGVLSILFDRPCIYTAQAFYADDALNRGASKADDVLKLLQEGFTVDQDSRLRFLSYLLEDFYSFGKFTVTEKAYTDNATLSITERIDYYRVNLLGERILDTDDRERIVDPNAPIYDLYREWIRSNKHTEWQASPSRAPQSAAPPSRASQSADEVSRKGRSAFHAKKYQEAARMFDTACSIQPNRATHYRAAAEALFAMGNRDIALSRLEKARLLAPDNKSIQRRIREMKRPYWMQFRSKPFPIAKD
ncbi:glycosyltransferase [Sinorhizobium meliloti]|nr:glycosyltransferase [Sinorhizobium meliloti]